MEFLCSSLASNASVFIHRYSTTSLQGKKISDKKLAVIERLIEPWYLFSLVWSVGATCDGDSRKKFDVFLREKISKENVYSREYIMYMYIVCS